MLKDFSQIKEQLSAMTKTPRLGVIVAQDESTPWRQSPEQPRRA